MTATWTTQKGATIAATRDGLWITAKINGRRTIAGLMLVDHPQHGRCLSSGNNYIPVAVAAMAAVRSMHAECVAEIRRERAADPETKAAAHRAKIYRAMDAPKRPRGRQLGYRAANPKKDRIAVAATAEYKAQVEALAAAAKLTVSDYVRGAIELRRKAEK